MGEVVVLRLSSGTLIAAKVVAACFIGLTVWALVGQGLGGLPVLIFTGPIILAAVAAHRVSVRYDDSGVVVEDRKSVV